MGRAVSFLLLLLCGCSRQQPQSAEELYRDTFKTFRQGQLDQAYRQAEYGGEAWNQGTGPPWELQFKLLRAEILVAQGKSGEALKLLNSPPFDQPLPAKFEARNKMIQANARLKLSDYDSAGPLLEDAHRLASASSQPAVRLETELLRGTLLSRTRKLAEAERVFRDVLRSAREQGDTYIEASALNNLGLIRVRSFRFDEAVPHFEQALSAFEQLGATIYSAAVLGNLSLCHFRLGNFESALSQRLRANELHEQAGAQFYLQQGLGITGLLYLTQGDWARSAEYSRRALSLARELNARYDTSVWASNLAEALAQMKQWEEAERLNNEALQLKRELNDTASQAFCQLTAGTIAAGRGRFDDAIAILTELAGSTDNQWLLWS
ncbi:MAG: tetratricopeptide repeat protein, partial [Bryobacteraceae bacterium]